MTLVESSVTRPQTASNLADLLSQINESQTPAGVDKLRKIIVEGKPDRYQYVQEWRQLGLCRLVDVSVLNTTDLSDIMASFARLTVEQQKELNNICNPNPKIACPITNQQAAQLVQAAVEFIRDYRLDL